MSKSYVVMELEEDFSYRMLDSGYPVAVFNNRTEADAKAKELERQRFRGIELGMYGDDIRDLTNLTISELADALPFLAEHIGFNGEIWGLDIPEDLSDAELDAVVDAFDEIRFYDVVEVVQ